MKTAGSEGNTMFEQVIIQTSCCASTISKRELSDAENKKLRITLLITNVLMVLVALFAAIAT